MSQELTLQQLLDGGPSVSVQRVRIKGLEALPPAAVSRLRSVEVLDVSGGSLQDLPANVSELCCLKILFASNNSFALAPCLRPLPSLTTVAFRSNRMLQLSSACLPQQLRWLILTDNLIQQIPDEIGVRRVTPWPKAPQPCLLKPHASQDRARSCKS